jgi:hypothetical protein
MIDSNYKKYLLSDKWQLKREKLFDVRGKICERCKSKKDIQVHHKTYKNIFNESLNDLEVLCKRCHMAHHRKEKLKSSKNKKVTKRKYQGGTTPKKIVELFKKGLSIKSIAKLKSLYIYDVLDMKKSWLKNDAPKT